MLAVRNLIPAWLWLLAALGAGGAAMAQNGVPEHREAPAGGGAAPTRGHGEQAPAAGGQAPAAGAQGTHTESGHEADGHGHEKLTLEMTSSEIFLKQFSHSVPYAIWSPSTGNPSVDKMLTVYNVQPWQWVGLVLLFLLFFPVVGSFGRASNGWLVRVLRGFCLWVRDDLVYAVMGKEDGRPFVPFFMFLFFFLVAQNVIGLIPSVGHHFPTAIYTATGTPFVTGAFAVVTLGMMLVFGMKKNGVVGFWKGLVPHGLPLPLIPIMLLIELVSLLVKPFALTIRLFANMLAGHLVIASAIGLVFLFAKLLGGTALSYLTAVPCVGMAIFIYIIEAFVTLLQAYIFSLLSVTFIYQAMHQEH